MTQLLQVKPCLPSTHQKWWVPLQCTLPCVVCSGTPGVRPQGSTTHYMT